MCSFSLLFVLNYEQSPHLSPPFPIQSAPSPTMGIDSISPAKSTFLNFIWSSAEHTPIFGLSKRGNSIGQRSLTYTGKQHGYKSLTEVHESL